MRNADELSMTLERVCAGVVEPGAALEGERDACVRVARALLAEVRCECGADGVHPFPIGGGWALACDECREASIMDAAVGMPGEGADGATWETWRVAAFGA